MKKICPLIYSIILIISLNACNSNKWQPLFNGTDLDNWDKHLGTPLRGEEFQELAQNATTDKVFSVVEMDGENLIRISGEINGAIATKEPYENYHLQFIYKWGDEVYTQLNSGILYHSFGEFGEALGTWMTCIEHQLANGNAGATYLMNITNCEITASRNEGERMYSFNPDAESVAFGANGDGQFILMAEDKENEVGEWNTIDLYCYGRTSVHVVNGTTVMVNTNCGYYGEDNTIVPLSSGKIQIQSEGGEIFIKSINIKEIDSIPEEVLP